jgi:hypothetical protein
VAIDLGCDHPGHHSPDFFDWTATDLDFGDKCECLHKSSDANGAILVATECLRADKTFAGRVQIALNSAFAEVENAFVHGKPNKQFQGTIQLESNLRYHIHHKILHLFDICHKYCDGHKPTSNVEAPPEEKENITTQVDEDADLEFLGATEYSIPWYSRKGTVVTCPHQQRQIIYYLNKKVVAAIPHLIVPDYGVVNTNANEGVGGRALFSRGKNILIGPVQLATKEVRNLIVWRGEKGTATPKTLQAHEMLCHVGQQPHSPKVPIQTTGSDPAVPANHHSHKAPTITATSSPQSCPSYYPHQPPTPTNCEHPAAILWGGLRWYCRL